jgi:hypothetical protein
VIKCNPDMKHVSTSFAERANLSIRMGNRRMTRLTNAFSRKIENHVYAMAIYFMHENFVRIHQTLRVTPAMAAGVTDKPWDLEDMAALLDKQAPTKRGPYQKKATYPVHSAVIGSLACIATHPAIAAELPRDGVFVYSTLCIERESGDAAGNRIRLVRSERGDSLYFEWSEGPRYGPTLASMLVIDPKTSKITFTLPANAPPNDLPSSQTYPGEISANAII